MSITDEADRDAIEVEGPEHLTDLLREAVSTGDVPAVLGLLHLARTNEGLGDADQLYAEIVGPGFNARWSAHMRDEPDAPDLTDDERKMLCALIADRIEQALEHGTDEQRARAEQFLEEVDRLAEGLELP